MENEKWPLDQGLSLKRAFRNDIQGLRALAVLSVLLFHIDFAFIPGGFLGVDVFFVISGFLITGNILSRQERGTFTLNNFFIRRLRRLMPAAIVTILLTLLASRFLLSPADVSSAGKSGFHSIFFGSNINFWLESGYFDAESATKPSLSHI